MRYDAEVFPPNVSERHVDFLLEEEFRVNPAFLKRFVSAVDQKLAPPMDIVNVQLSVCDVFGEADLVVLYRDEPSRRIALLIEDKIRAEFQPSQALRYQERGRSGTAKQWDEYRTCLIGPEIYVKSVQGFDAVLYLEHIKEWLSPEEPARHEFKAEVVERAIKKAETTGVQEEDPAMTQFRADYFDFFNSFFKDEPIGATTTPPRKAWKGDSWFDVRSKVLPKGVYINHKSERGLVDLTFPSTNADLLLDIKRYLEPAMKIEQTYNSAAIRLEVPKIANFNDFAAETHNVQQGLTAVRKLLTFYDRERNNIEGILLDARRLKASAS